MKMPTDKIIALNAIQDSIALIDKNDFGKFYFDLHDWEYKPQVIGYVTTCLLEADIHPLDYLNYIPFSYLYGQVTDETYYIPKHIKTIGMGAFEGCMDLTTIYIPKSVTTIGDHAFYDCTNLTDIYYEGSIKDWAYVALNGSDIFPTNIREVTIHCSDQPLILPKGFRS